MSSSGDASTNEASTDDVAAVFDTGGAGKCRCQALKVAGWIWRDTTQLQRDALTQAGCARIFEETIYTRSSDRPGLAAMIFHTIASANIITTAPHRTTRKWLLHFQKTKPIMPAVRAISAPLDEAAITITIEAIIAGSASRQYLALWYHKATNRGNCAAPNVPAKIGCRKAP